jgi:hypothetical protein
MDYGFYNLSVNIILTNPVVSNITVFVLNDQLMKYGGGGGGRKTY